MIFAWINLCKKTVKYSGEATRATSSGAKAAIAYDGEESSAFDCKWLQVPETVDTEPEVTCTGHSHELFSPRSQIGHVGRQFETQWFRVTAREYQLLIAEMREQQRITRETTPPSSPVHHEHEPTERTNPSPSNVTNQNKGSKACCFCWCCCCSCSCLTMRNTGNNNAKRDTNVEMLNGDTNETPTLEEIRSWAQSFDAVMKSARGRKKFREFLRSEYSEENLMFWLACEDLQKESNSACVEEKARLIYEDFISILSPKEVSLDSKVREAVNINMTTPDIHTFDEAQQQIYILMHRDSFPRFVNSKMFRNLMEAAASKES